MEEPRAEAEAGGDFFNVAHGMANGLELGFVRLVHMDVAEHGEIIADLDAAEMRLDVTAKRGVAAGRLLQRRGVLLVRVELQALVSEDGSFRGKRAVLFVLGGELARGDLAGFNVRLVERIDADDRTSDGGSDFPAQHFLAQLINVRHGDANYRLARLLERRYGGVLLRVRRRFQAQVREQAIVSVDSGSADGFAVHRNQTLAVLAGGFSEKLFEPRADIGDAGRGEDGDLVAASLCQRSHDGAQNHAGVLVRGDNGGARVNHFFHAVEELQHVHALDGGGNHSEIRERRVAAADAREPVKNVAEAIVLGDLLHLRAGIGDGDESLPHFVGANLLLHAIVEVLFEDVRLERAAGLARNDANRAGQIHFAFDFADLRRIGGVENNHLRVTLDRTVRELHHLDAQARTAHAKQQRVLEARRILGDLLETRLMRDLVVRNSQPAEPVAFIGAGPERGVARPQALHLVIRLPIFERGLHGLREIVGHFVGEVV